MALLRARFPGRRVRFRGHASLSTQTTMVHAVDFAPDHVWVTVNLGLLSATSPLPSYFVELRSHPRAGPALEGLLGLLDDGLLRDRAEGLRPELAERFLPRPREVRDDVLALSRPASPITLHWMFATVFPELGVSVRRASVRRGLPTDHPRLGTAVLGSSALGGEAELATPGLTAILWAEESTTWAGEPWALAARRRLEEHVLPALRASAAHLRVVLVDHEGQGRLALSGPSLVGFDPLGRALPPRVTMLFEGRVPPC